MCFPPVNLWLIATRYNLALSLSVAIYTLLRVCAFFYFFDAVRFDPRGGSKTCELTALSENGKLKNLNQGNPNFYTENYIFKAI